MRVAHVHRPARSVRTSRRTSALVAVVSLLLGLVVVLAGSATAASSLWSASAITTAPGSISNVKDGSSSAAQFTYSSVGGGFGEQTWGFESTYDPGAEIPEAAEVRVPWSWQGFHAYFNVTAELRAYTVQPDGSKDYQTLVSAGPASCCTTPSAGFSYGGMATFSLLAGQEYGFELSGSNGDSTNVVQGTFTLSTKPYLDSLGSDNRQWTKATPVIDSPADGADGGVQALAAAEVPADVTGSKQDRIRESGESRWFRVPVIPGQTVSATLAGLPRDYDLALYGDIGQALDRLTSDPDATNLAAGAAAGTAGNGSQVPEFPELVTAGTLGPAKISGPSFAPRAYAPRAYAPRAYAPRAYAPRAYAPRAYAPRAYAPASFDPAVQTNTDFQQAFSTAQEQSLIAVSSRSGTGTETVSARTGNTRGSYYLRVQGHGDGDFSDTEDFTVSATVSGGSQCARVTPSAVDLWGGPPPTGAPRTIIVTDTTGFEGADADLPAMTTALAALARAEDGVVVDLAQSRRVEALKAQVKANLGCPYGVNLVAEAVDEIVEAHTTAATEYVVLAGGDDIVPFFRYPDLAGLAPESLFKDTMKAGTPAGESLAQDQLLSQDAYGSQTDVTISGSTLAVPDLAVGRLVKSPTDITDTVAHHLATGGAAIEPDSSLVTGYDFLVDAAHAVSDEFTAATGKPGDELISDPEMDGDVPWDAAQLSQALLDPADRHDLVYLAGHFNANQALAADFETYIEASDLEPAGDERVLEDTLVLSAGCHSGYGVVPGQEENAGTYDWAQAMAQQRALLIGGTGYQYGDTEFLEYSERIYLNVARELRRPGTEAVPVGEALMEAKRDYLASLTSVTGMDQKAVLQATMYGLPMVAVDAPNRRTADTVAPSRTPAPVAADTPGRRLGLTTAEVDVRTGTTGRSTTVEVVSDDATLPSTQRLSWLEGEDGVSLFPGEPVLPKQVVDVTAPDTVLRGVGFRSGDYTDTAGTVPLTGAPAVESSTPHTSFETPVWFPQRLASPNYFDSLGGSGQAGRTSLVLTPAQYRTDPSTAAAAIPTNTRRAYTNLGYRLFYSDGTTTVGANAPYQAAAPAISEVTGTLDGRQVTVSARVTGDPSAGVQEAWLTWTGERSGDSGHGRWRSVDLQQDALDSTLWRATFRLDDGQSMGGYRFLVQAANGVGAVSLDAAEGNGYGLSVVGADDAVVDLGGIAAVDSFEDLEAQVTDSSGVPLANRGVVFTLARGDDVELTSVGTTDPNGVAAMPAPFVPGSTTVLEAIPSGAVTLTAEVLPPVDSTLRPAEPVTRDLVIDGATITLTPTAPATAMTRAGTLYGGGTTATVTDARGVVPGASVTFAFPTSGPRATYTGAASSTKPTGVSGTVTSPTPRAGIDEGGFDLTVSTPGATSVARRHTSQYAFTAFGSPVSKDKVSTNVTASVPLKLTALDSTNRAIPGVEATGLVTSKQVRISWQRTSGKVGQPSGSTDTLARYVADKGFFQADLKPSSFGWGRGTYVVQYVVLDQAGAAAGVPALHLGASRTVTITVS